MKLTDLLKDIQIGKVYTAKDRPPFKVNEEKTFSESTKAYGKSLEKIANDKKLKMISKKDRDTLKRLANLMKEEKIDEAGYAGVMSPPPHSSPEAKKIVDDALRMYSKELRKLQAKVIKDWMSKAKAGAIDFFDLVRGFKHGDISRAYPYETDFLMSVLTKDKIIDRFRKYFGGKKAMNNRTATKRK